jgi:hypothetical protein
METMHLNSQLVCHDELLRHVLYILRALDRCPADLHMFGTADCANECMRI